jgi:hypothetical protein
MTVIAITVISFTPLLDVLLVIFEIQDFLTCCHKKSMNLSQGNHKLRLKNVYERENPILKNR